MRRMLPGFLIVVMIAGVPGCSKKNEQRLLIATSANMQYAMEELVEEFESDNGVKCEMVISSSGKLTAQIMQGAPFDVFVSADAHYPETLYTSGKGKRQPQIYAYGKLILWSVGWQGDLSLTDLTSPKVRHIAIANPETAPYGRASMEVLNNEGILEKVKSKLVTGESISQVNQFVTSGAAQVGFTSLSTVRTTSFETTSTWLEVDEGLYAPIAQAILLLNDRNPAADSFVSFVLGEEGERILKRHGYKRTME